MLDAASLIKIGDYWGRKLDYWKDTIYYVRFRLLTGIRLINWRQCREATRDPFMYVRDEFDPNPGQVVLDIGSQYGDYALIWERKFKCTVYAFEASPENFTKLQKNISANRSDLKAYNVAIGNGGKIVFDFSGGMFHKSIEGQSIVTVRLDDWVNENNISPSLLKIDVEGAEYEALEGAEDTIREAHPKIILETHSKALREKCDTFLKRMGYSLSAEGRTVSTKTNDEITNLFYLPG